MFDKVHLSCSYGRFLHTHFECVSYSRNKRHVKCCANQHKQLSFDCRPLIMTGEWVKHIDSSVKLHPPPPTLSHHSPAVSLSPCYQHQPLSLMTTWPKNTRLSIGVYAIVITCHLDSERHRTQIRLEEGGTGMDGWMDGWVEREKGGRQDLHKEDWADSKIIQWAHCPIMQGHLCQPDLQRALKWSF